MIIRYPTGLYVDQLPKQPSDEGNVTYTISNNNPSTSQGNFIIYPVAEKLKKRSTKHYNQEERRATMGNLVYTLTSGGVSAVGRSTKLFEVGQVLEFTDEEPSVSGVDSVPNRVEIQHNTNLLDLEALGLTEAEAIQLQVDSATLKEQLEIQLTDTQNQIADNKSSIVELQKTINEANKALSAIAALGEDEDFAAKIRQTKQNAEDEQSTLIVQTNSLEALASTIEDKLLAVSQLVR